MFSQKLLPNESNGHLLVTEAPHQETYQTLSEFMKDFTEESDQIFSYLRTKTDGECGLKAGLC